jgi:tetratricopeptide (TPR) repeat protein
MAHLADSLKAQGNESFRRGEFVEAEDFYTQAIQKNPGNPLLFTNRANARLKLHRWEEAALDCNKAIEITGQNAPNHKAYYFLGEWLFLLCFGVVVEGVQGRSATLRLWLRGHGRSLGMVSSAWL